jgi:predicted ATPase
MDHARRSRPSGLPAELTSFVGRRAELREVKRLLGTTRLLTLTGSGGAGKTRLALRAAADMARGFPDGAWLVSLAPVRDPLLVPQAVFGALGVQDLSAGLSLSSLAGYLTSKRLLLVLDNCEHLLDGCATLAGTLLPSCPDLQVLATSRQALGVAGEVRMVVPPMSLPEAGAEISVQQNWLSTYTPSGPAAARSATYGESLPHWRSQHRRTQLPVRGCSGWRRSWHSTRMTTTPARN